MPQVGKAYVQIVPTTKGIKNAIESEMSGDVQSSGLTLGGRLGGAIKAAISAAGIGKFLGTAIRAGGALEQSLGGVETLFKTSADTVFNYAQNAYKTAGLSANEYMEQAVNFSAALISSLGGDTKKAAEVSNMAILDMADNARKMGSNVEDVQNAYQGFSKQNYTMLDNLKLGYQGTKEEMQRLLADAEKLTGVHYDINNLSDVYKAIHAIQENLKITGSAAEEVQHTIQGSFDGMKGAFKNVLSFMATGKGNLNEALQGLAETSSNFLFNNLIPMIGKVLTQLPGAVAQFAQLAGQDIMKQLTSAFPELAPVVQRFMDIIGPSISSFMEALGGLWTAMQPILQELATAVIPVLQIIVSFIGGVIVGAIMRLTPVIQALKIAMEVLYPVVGLIIEILKPFTKMLSDIAMGVGVLVGVFGQFGFSATSLKSVMDKVWNGIRNLVTSVAKGLMNPINGLKSLFNALKSAGTALRTGLTNSWNGITNAVKSAWGNIQGVINNIKNLFNSLKNIDLKSAGEAVINGFIDGLKAAFSGLMAFVGGIANWIKEHKGPISYDRVLLIPAGKAIMQGLDEGLQTQFKAVKRTVSHMGGELADTFGSTPLTASMTMDALNAQQPPTLTRTIAMTANVTRTNDPLKALNQKVDTMVNLLDGLLNKDTDVYLDKDRVSTIIGQEIRREDAMKQKYNNRRMGVII
ncbi:MAG: phage tail protein [Aerococcus sp.]|nr:phage tail protein [Aerococcus sp.]